MNRFFSQDSPAMKFLTFLCDMMYVNFLFLICSLPVFTLGASMTAMYSVLFKRIRGEEPPIAKSFFGAFKNNFKQATIVWVPFLLIIIFLFTSLFIAHNLIDSHFTFLQYPISILIFVLFAVIIYVFPQLALFDSPLKQIIRNSFLLSLGNFPITITILVMHVLLILIAGLSPTMTYVVISILLFLGIATLSYFCALFYRRIFNKIIGEEDAV